MHSERKFKNVVLTGLPGTGKSTLGKTFAYLSRRNFFDLDRLVTESARKSIAEIIETEGEDSFRSYEARALKRLSRMHNAVIAVGGGTLCNEQNLLFAKQHALIVTVEANLDTVATRIFSERETRVRPLLQAANSEAELKEKLENLLRIREEYYSKSDVFVSSTYSSIDMLALELWTLERKMFHREFQRVVAAVGEYAPPHLYTQGPYFLIKRKDYVVNPEATGINVENVGPEPEHPKGTEPAGERKKHGRHDQNRRPNPFDGGPGGKPNRGPRQNQGQGNRNQDRRPKPTKEPVKAAVKEPVREPVKEPIKEPAKEPVKEPVRES